MEPLGKMNAIFPVVNEQINKRNKKVCRHSSYIGTSCLRRVRGLAPRLRRRAQQDEQAYCETER